MFAKLVSDHDRAVLAFAGGCCVGRCDKAAEVVWPGRYRYLAYCQAHWDGVKEGYAQLGEC